MLFSLYPTQIWTFGTGCVIKWDDALCVSEHEMKATAEKVHAEGFGAHSLEFYNPDRYKESERGDPVRFLFVL